MRDGSQEIAFWDPFSSEIPYMKIISNADITKNKINQEDLIYSSTSAQTGKINDPEKIASLPKPRVVLVPSDEADFLGDDKTMNSIAEPGEFISIDQASQMSGWSKAWIIRELNSAGVTRIGEYFLRDEFISYFRERAKRRQQRIMGRNRPVVIVPRPVRTKTCSARDLVRELLRKEGP